MGIGMGERPYCSRCGERKDEHVTDERGGLVCADQTTRDERPNATHAQPEEMTVFRGERVGRRRADY